MTATAPIQASIRIAATPAQVFPFLTESQLLIEWLGQSAELEPHAGGAFAVEVGGIPVRGAYLAVEPPKRVVFTWGFPGHATVPPGSSTVEISLREDGGETVVELVHRDLPAAERPPHERGWQACLSALARAAS